MIWGGSVRKGQRNDCSHFADGKPKTQKGCGFPASRNTGLRPAFHCGVLARDPKAPGQAWAASQLLHSSARGPKGEGWRKARTKVVYPEELVTGRERRFQRAAGEGGRAGGWMWVLGDGCACCVEEVGAGGVSRCWGRVQEVA